ncbi:MAG: 7-cyano-7-deazaguanine synthase QueC [Spirochaetales bacterium]|nr:7-cyano-7-deazaguanine synthase QueC [Spirochaetales bacterium]
MEQSYKNEDTLVLFSGGQDSTTSLFWALDHFRNVSTLCFYYAQKHSHEVTCAKKICRKLNIKIKTVDISFMKTLVISHLFKHTGTIDKEHHPLKEDVPSSFVPYRNLLFLVLAAAWASTLGIRHLVTGVCETDSSGYADCRDVFIKSARETLHLATDFQDQAPVIHTPLMWLSKAETFKLAEELGCLDFILKYTLTCYYGKKKMNIFGMGCGKCPACLLRKTGFEGYMKKYKKKGRADG